MGLHPAKTKRPGYRSVNVRLAARDKELAESIFRRCGLTPTEAIRLFYRQTINTGGLPFGLALPEETLAAMREAESGTVEELSLDDLKAELDKMARQRHFNSEHYDIAGPSVVQSMREEVSSDGNDDDDGGDGAGHAGPLAA